MKPKNRPSFKEVVDYITHLVVPGSGSNTGNEYIITGDSNPGGGAHCTTESKRQVPPKNVSLRTVDNRCNKRQRNDITRPAHAVANASMRNARARSKANENTGRYHVDDPAIEETSFTTSYFLHHKAAVQKPSDNECSKEHTYGCLAESPSYADVGKTSNEDNEEACHSNAFPNTPTVSVASGIQRSDSPIYGNLLTQDNDEACPSNAFPITPTVSVASGIQRSDSPIYGNILTQEGLQFVRSDDGADHGDPYQVGEQEPGAEQAGSLYCDMSGYLAAVESPMNTDEYDFTLY